MGLTPEKRQRIAQLAPLGDVYAAVDRIVVPVAAREVDPETAAGSVLAADVIAPRSGPAVPSAVRDGWAVSSDLVADAGPYAPVPLAAPPVWVDQGDPLPQGCDAILPADALLKSSAGCEAIASAAPGEGVVPAAFDHAAGAKLLSAGHRLRGVDCAVLRAAGVKNVAVRSPRIAVIDTRVRGADAAASFLIRAVAGAAATVTRVQASREALAQTLRETPADAVITIGGSGEGSADRTGLAVATAGDLLLHGMGIRPGESAGLGIVASRPVLLLPGRLDAAVAAWLLVGRRMLSRLSGEMPQAAAPSGILTRKITSTIGLAEVVLVVAEATGVRPLASGIFPSSALAQATGWVLVPPESEGYPVGASVDIHSLP